MNHRFVTEFTDGLREARQITPGDVRILRSILANDLVLSRDHIGALIDAHVAALAGPFGAPDLEWDVLLTETVVDHVVWGERPTGVVTHADAAWLLERLGAADGVLPASHRALVVSIVREAQQADITLTQAVFCAQLRPSRAPVTQTLGWLDQSGIGV